MKILCTLSAILALIHYVKSAAVFAHFMIGNVPDWTQAVWENDIRIAQDAHIEAFVLNMAESDPKLRESIAIGFAAAGARNFKLLFSFDYAGGIPEGTSWRNKATVTALINQYKGHSAYYLYNGRALVSTFEGPGQAADWETIKQQTNCFFIPSYSSLGAEKAMQTKVPNGLFSWAAWPWGNMNGNTYVDESYRMYLGEREYMMPVSPWFYTNMPGFNKNWLWRGDDLWFDRWRDVLAMKPAFVQIITWNDWGESHYIGPLRSGTYGAFETGKSTYNYALDMPHDGWRLFLPFIIDTYKLGKGTVQNEGLVTWYRKHPKSACTDGGTTGNTASQLLVEFPPGEVVQDKIFYAALLGKGGGTRWVRVTIGGTTLPPGEFQRLPDGGVGIYQGSIDTMGLTGAVTVTVRRDSMDIVKVDGIAITTTCQANIQNYNAWVGYNVGPAITPIQPAQSLSEQVCVQGAGAGNFNTLCDFTCSYGYCPAACHCLKLGRQKEKPKTTTLKAFPAKGLDDNYGGLCDFACNLDKSLCETSTCSLTRWPTPPPANVSPFLPTSCVAGKGANGMPGNDELCKWTCQFAYCPIHICQCTARGALELHQNVNESKVCKASKANANNPDYANICKFSGFRDNVCPVGPCEPPPPPTTTRASTTASRTPTSTPQPPAPSCKTNPTWVDGAETRVGEYPKFPFEAEYISTRTYFTIVNLTPHRFKFRADLSPKPYQIAIDFGDVPAGTSRQNVCQYRSSGSNPKDDNADMYYEVVGPGHIFHIKCTTHIPDTHPRRVIVDLAGWGQGWREYDEPAAETPVTWVITGSESFGYVHSMSWASSGKTNWMQGQKEVLKNRKLKHVVMPGSHDAGMSRMGKMTFFGTSATTQTQGVSLYDQLRAGSRYLDFRVITWFDEFLLAHISSITDVFVVGASGETLTEGINNINKFTAENPGEMIVIWLKELGEVSAPVGEGRRWVPKIVDMFWTEMLKINNRCGNLEGNIPDMTMETLWKKSGDKGCVFIVNGGWMDPNYRYTIPEQGVYQESGSFGRKDFWSETGELEDLVASQTKAYPGLRSDPSKDTFHISQWQLTPDLNSAGMVGLKAYALLESNPTIYWAGVNAMSPTGFPTVLMQDYIGMNIMDRSNWDALGAELKTLALGLNLYLVSENCDIDKRSHPLLAASTARRMPASVNDAIFSNGTVIQDIPPNFNPNCTAIYEKGTEFMDGTVLKEALPNPFCT